MPPLHPSYPELMLPWHLRWSYTEESTRASAVVVYRALCHRGQDFDRLDKHEFREETGWGPARGPLPALT
jgi:hypothetical protein